MILRTLGLILGLAVVAILVASLIPKPKLDDGHDHPATPPTPKPAIAKKPTIIEIRKGTGRTVEPGDVVTVHYEGFLKNGTKIDSTVDKGQPMSFLLGGGMLMPGWEAGLEGARVGDKRKLIVPPDLAYGAQGSEDGKIPPNATIVFVIEVLKVQKIEDEPLLDPLLKTEKRKESSGTTK